MISSESPSEQAIIEHDSAPPLLQRFGRRFLRAESPRSRSRAFANAATRPTSSLATDQSQGVYSQYAISPLREGEGGPRFSRRVAQTTCCLGCAAARGGRKRPPVHARGSSSDPDRPAPNSRTDPSFVFRRLGLAPGSFLEVDADVIESCLPSTTRFCAVADMERIPVCYSRENENSDINARGTLLRSP